MMMQGLQLEDPGYAIDRRSLAAEAAAICPRRWTISTSLGGPRNSGRRTQRSGGNTACTHHTVVRLYTNQHHCAICTRSGGYGWIYRCTQDQELLLENEMETGNANKLDSLCDELKSSYPHKRSPAARVNPFSMLAEVTEEQLKTYTEEQLQIVLSQRAQVLDACCPADRADYGPVDEGFNWKYAGTDIHAPAPGLPKKPWLPLEGGECQFKVCHTCRRDFQDRCVLSLVGVVNGEYPATALTGYGFHLRKTRPVSLVKHVKNLGLRPNPAPRVHHSSSQTSSISSSGSGGGNRTPPRALPVRLKTSPNRPQGIIKRRPASIGLGIFETERQQNLFPNASHPDSRPATAINTVHHTMGPPHSVSIAPFIDSSSALSLKSTPTRRHSYYPTASSSDLQALASNTHLQPISPESAGPSGSLTPMEWNEQLGDVRGAPSGVMDGVVVTEEGVELQVPDVDMQK
ncbi:unnamed protein product [Diplocarpon coronariae]